MLKLNSSATKQTLGDNCTVDLTWTAAFDMCPAICFEADICLPSQIIPHNSLLVASQNVPIISIYIDCIDWIDLDVNL